ncbi:hypothetical protein GDO78_017684 [Eleutherodactylus coqui]|uniref:Uncharacterized protein n=1 Tax=Eleutherodactylus coqui TaxID=57060 RepID=A0A8J6BAB3_ELECQ|nr:hypothetical protein GDO78_017684 [Eleutherodactylus coqui]
MSSNIVAPFSLECCLEIWFCRDYIFSHAVIGMFPNMMLLDRTVHQEPSSLEINADCPRALRYLTADLCHGSRRPGAGACRRISAVSLSDRLTVEHRGKFTACCVLPSASEESQ